MFSFHLLCLPRQEFSEPGRCGLDDLFIQRPYEGVERRVIERLENPLAMLYPQILKHRKGLLSLLDDGSKRHHDLRDGGLQFKRSGFWVRDVCDHEVRQPGEQPDSFSEILRLWLVEVENDRQVAAVSEFFPQPLQDLNAALSEAAQQKHAFLSDGVDHVADLLVVEQEMDELRDLNVVDGDLGLIRVPCNDQVMLLDPFQF